MSNNLLSLPNPPIVEAIFNIQTSGGHKLEDIDKAIIKDFLSDAYLDFGPCMEAAFQFDETNATQAVAPNIELKGYRASSQGKSQVVQYFDNNFTFNRLKPYQGYDYHLVEALRLWESFKKFTQAECISRITLRNVNQINFKQEHNLEDLFTVYPERAEFAGLTRNGFNLRGQFSDANTGIQCNVVLIQKDAQINSYFLDVECYIDLSEPASVDVSLYFDKLRKLKNKIFTGALTQKGLELLKTL